MGQLVGQRVQAQVVGVLYACKYTRRIQIHLSGEIVGGAEQIQITGPAEHRGGGRLDAGAFNLANTHTPQRQAQVALAIVDGDVLGSQIQRAVGGLDLCGAARRHVTSQGHTGRACPALVFEHQGARGHKRTQVVHIALGHRHHTGIALDGGCRDGATARRGLGHGADELFAINTQRHRARRSRDGVERGVVGANDFYRSCARVVRGDFTQQADVIGAASTLDSDGTTHLCIAGTVGVDHRAVELGQTFATQKHVACSGDVIGTDRQCTGRIAFDLLGPDANATVADHVLGQAKPLR